MAMKPYVSQDEDGGWYADSIGVMQGGDPKRTQAEALQWALDRLWAHCQQEDVQADTRIQAERGRIAEWLARRLIDSCHPAAVVTPHMPLQDIRDLLARIRSGELG